MDDHEIVPKCLSEYHTFSNVEFQKHSRIDNKPMYMKILTVWALTSEKNLQIQFPGSQMYSTRRGTHPRFRNFVCPGPVQS